MLNCPQIAELNKWMIIVHENENCTGKCKLYKWMLIANENVKCTHRVTLKRNSEMLK